MEPLEPHQYHPSLAHMGDCWVCGNMKEHSIHQFVEHDFFPVGTKVRKKKGYEFISVVEASFILSHGPSKGQRRYVVNCTAPGVEGCLHIFSTDDLEYQK